VVQLCFFSVLQELIKFAYEEKIVLMADEVYQENIYQDERPFVSARKVQQQQQHRQQLLFMLDMLCHVLLDALLAPCCSEQGVDVCPTMALRAVCSGDV
jgi:hypothetical protein